MIFKFGFADGLFVTILTWTFFVFCTPIADAGFILDFPIRIITGFKMIYVEFMVWVIAFSINLYAFFFSPSTYSQTIVLRLFYHVITHPIPYSLIILVSLAGTFLSLLFGDELMEVLHHSHRKKYKAHAFKYKFILVVFSFLVLLLLYDFLIVRLGVNF